MPDRGRAGDRLDLCGRHGVAGNRPSGGSRTRDLSRAGERANARAACALVGQLLASPWRRLCGGTAATHTKNKRLYTVQVRHATGAPAALSHRRHRVGSGTQRLGTHATKRGGRPRRTPPRDGRARAYPIHEPLPPAPL